MLTMDGRQYLSVAEYARRRGVTPARVRQLLMEGRLPEAQKIGRDWFIPATARPVPGRRGPKPVAGV